MRMELESPWFDLLVRKYSLKLKIKIFLSVKRTRKRKRDKKKFDVKLKLTVNTPVSKIQSVDLP